MAYSQLGPNETVIEEGDGWRVVLAVSTIDPDVQGGWRSWRTEYENGEPS